VFFRTQQDSNEIVALPTRDQSTQVSHVENGSDRKASIQKALDMRAWEEYRLAKSRREFEEEEMRDKAKRRKCEEESIKIDLALQRKAALGLEKRMTEEELKAIQNEVYN